MVVLLLSGASYQLTWSSQRESVSEGHCKQNINTSIRSVPDLLTAIPSELIKTSMQSLRIPVLVVSLIMNPLMAVTFVMQCRRAGRVSWTSYTLGSPGGAAAYFLSGPAASSERGRSPRYAGFLPCVRLGPLSGGCGGWTRLPEEPEGGRHGIAERIWLRLPAARKLVRRFKKVRKIAGAGDTRLLTWSTACSCMRSSASSTTFCMPPPSMSIATRPPSSLMRGTASISMGSRPLPSCASHRRKVVRGVPHDHMRRDIGLRKPSSS